MVDPAKFQNNLAPICNEGEKTEKIVEYGLKRGPLEVIGCENFYSSDKFCMDASQALSGVVKEAVTKENAGDLCRIGLFGPCAMLKPKNGEEYGTYRGRISHCQEDLSKAEPAIKAAATAGAATIIPGGAIIVPALTEGLNHLLKK